MPGLSGIRGRCKHNDGGYGGGGGVVWGKGGPENEWGVAIDFRGRLKYCVAVYKRKLLSLSLYSRQIKKYKCLFSQIIILICLKLSAKYLIYRVFKAGLTKKNKRANMVQHGKENVSRCFYIKQCQLYIF